MYCRRCGKLIDYDADVCKECLEEMLINEMGKKDRTEEVKVIDPDETEDNFFDSVQEIVPPQPEKKKSESMGSQPVFKKALFSVIASSVAMVTLILGYFFVIMGITMPLFIGFGAILMAASIVFMIISLAIATKSLSEVKRLAESGQKRNIPAMVLSIVGIVMSASGLACAFMYVLILCAALLRL